MNRPEPLLTMKNRGFLERLGFALAGIATVFRRERSFRTQAVLAAAAAMLTLVLAPGAIWFALVMLTVGLVLALEMMNAAIEYLLDLLHPEIAEEIKAAKDAAAGAVLVGSIAALCVAGAMLLSYLA
jgi:diacylglycerol kinase (ATP)